MKKSKYLILSGLYFKFSDSLVNIELVKKSFEKQNILDLLKFDELYSFKESQFSQKNINFVYASNDIFVIEEYSFYKNHIKYINFSNCTRKFIIEQYSFYENQINYLKLPNKSYRISRDVFENNNIKYLNLLNCSQLTLIQENCFSENPLQEIKILERIPICYDIENSYNNQNDLWNKFVLYYNKTGQRAGDYKYEDNQWQWYPL